MSNYEEMVKKVRGKNINSTTLLATDYLNHFNEIVMLIEMIPNMVELIDEAEKWKPKGYIQHFQNSNFAYKELAIQAYEYVPYNYKKAFEVTVNEMNNLTITAIKQMNNIKENKEQLSYVTHQAFTDLQTLIAKMGTIINGIDITQTQDKVDKIIL